MTNSPVGQKYNLMPIWCPPCPASPPGPYIDRAKVTIVEVKDLRQTIVIETGYGETNAWLEWVKYSVCTLNKSTVLLV
jgi:hypothetical protein